MTALTTFCFFLLQMAVALIDFNTLLDHLQSPYSLPGEMLTSQEGLRFRDICFVLPRCTLNMQHISLTYLKSLISDNCFQPEGTPSDAASGSMAILVVFLSDEQHTTIQHVRLHLVVHCIGCNLYDQDGILPFINSIEEDLKKMRQKWDAGKDPGGVRIMAVPMDPPYCLVYPTIYSDDVATKNKNHFNTVGSPLGLHTHTRICHTLLQHADLTEAHKQKYNGSHLIVPHGT